MKLEYEENKQTNTGYQSNHRKIAMFLSLIPGLGQMYNRQFIKGIGFLILAASFLIVFWDFLDIGIWGLVTLGTTLPRDNSIFLLVNGIISILLLFFAAIFVFIVLRDAYKNGQKRDLGHRLNSMREQYRNLIDNGFPYLILSPGFFLLVFVVITPIIFVFTIAFTNYDLFHQWPASLMDWVGFENFQKLFTLEMWRSTFFNVFAWTLVWTFGATTCQIALGVFLAVIVNQKELKGKAIIRTVFILPWAVPAFVSILIFSGMFNQDFGSINEILASTIGVEIPWMTEPFWSRLALIMIQTWLGFPFIFVMVTGVLQAIPEELYEAAVVDGASALQKFRNITFPLIMFSIAPILITQYTFNFNNFNVIFLFNGGGPPVSGQKAGGTDILISWIYNLTMTSQQYGIAAAITLIMSAFVIAVAVWQFRRTKSFQEEDMM
ncbi:sugar ABC transporter permease [Pontibacillus yanchengensis]|uniref:Arabinogalactan ABC transporter permease n=1 Tax=Pontibacillus yanchengensis Y32 TaxID=1385514 RepID=A0A0A2T7N8_9BACI|nr:sugar ABC transporter permease [Pontibacillus yanchengensis]KGP71549.1 arabinogalactan ABC transporter permease [Pontibacillus yanchengensis Y32]